MVKNRKKKPPAARPAGPLFLTEWMEEQGVTDKQLADGLGLSNTTTIWRWQKSPTRLNPLKQAQVAKVLRIWPGQLWMHPKAKKMRLIKIVLEAEELKEEEGPKK